MDNQKQPTAGQSSAADTTPPVAPPSANLSPSAFPLRWVIIGVLAGLAIAGMAVGAWQRGQKTKKPVEQASQNQATASPPLAASTAPSASPSAAANQELIWQQGPTGWVATQTPPTCADTLLLAPPADLSKATGILYPGQTRGGNYKPHGGFRFDGVANDQITVTAPIDGFIVRGGHYLAEGEIQYTFDVMNNCGVMYRVGHFRVLPVALQALTTTWATAVEGDSRTHEVNPPVFLAKGEVLATTVGIIAENNTFFDWGVYDYRKTNAASSSTTFQQAHAQDKELAWHAVCWFDWLSAADEATVRALPAGDPTSGKQSDYCT